MQSFDRPSNHHAEAWSPGHASIYTERLWAGHNRSIYPMTSSFEAASLKSIDARLQMHRDASGIYESADLILNQLVFHINVFELILVKTMLTQYYIYDH